MNQRKILHILPKLGSGGVEALIYNWYMNMDRKKYTLILLLMVQK